MNNISIYRHIFPNGKVYIGQTCQKPEEELADYEDETIRKQKKK